VLDFIAFMKKCTVFNFLVHCFFVSSALLKLREGKLSQDEGKQREVNPVRCGVSLFVARFSSRRRSVFRVHAGREGRLKIIYEKWMKANR
jgi:hypothetical protein